MKTTLIALGALMITSAAYAQEPIPMNGVSLRLGIAFPLDNTLSGVNDNFTSVAIEFQQPTSLAKGTEGYLAVDYFSKSFGQFGKGSAIPITYNVRFNQRAAVGNRQSYAFAGLGVAILDLVGPSETVVAARGGFGMNVSDHTFVEAAGTFTASSNTNGSFNTIGLYFGYRF